MLRTDSPVVDLFHAFRKMSGNHEEICAFMKFQARDRNKVHPESVSSLAGQVSRFIFDLVKRECFRMERLTIRAIDGEIVTFTDTFHSSLELATALAHSSCSTLLLAVSFEVLARLPAAFFGLC